nr:three-Cys-motif partner protein TcmP [Thalassococcus sp. S3]
MEGVRIPERGLGQPPDQTNAKSKLIAEYIALFQRVTQGGLYIDGFAAPQSRRHEEAWTARRVLEIAPPRLRTFWLCDNDPNGLQQLEKLKTLHHRNPRFRRVFVMPGDFNVTVHTLLKSNRLTRRAAIFALLDQRNTECHWATVQAIAKRSSGMKIEQLYFFGSGWAHRSMKASKKPERLAEIDKWWGDRSWVDLRKLTKHDMVQRVVDRFADELGYAFVKPYPIYQSDDGKRKSFHLIHASDHPEAPKLMYRAYAKICGDRAGSPVDSQKLLPANLPEVAIPTNSCFKEP